MSLQIYNNKSNKKHRRLHTKRALVQMLDGNEIEFFLQEDSKGGALFNSVCTHLDLMERYYFGLGFNDQKKNMVWLMYDTKISKQVKRNPWKFELHVKFYPPNPNLLQEEITRYFLCLQLRQDLRSGRLPCSFGVCILLAAYVVQSELGDFDPNNHSDIEYVRKIQFAAKNSQSDELLYKISDLHKALRGLSPEEADSSFLSNAKKMCLYGIEMHKVMNSRDEEPFLIGVYYGGIVVHKGFLRINRIIWPRILKFSYKKNIFKLIFKERDLRTEMTKYQCSSHKLARKLWLSCAECHSFFRMRETEIFKKKSFLKKVTKINVGITLYQSQRNVFERTPPQFKRHPVTEAAISQSEMEFPGIEQPLEVANDNLEVDENNENRPLMNQKFIRFSFVDKSETIKYNPNDCFTVYTSKNLDDNDNEWLGCRTNLGIRKRNGEDFTEIVYFEMYVISQGMVKIGWSTNNCDFNKSEEYGSVSFIESNTQTSMRIHSMLTSPFGPVLNSDDVIGCFFDLSAQKVWWAKNTEEVSDKISIPEQILEIGLYPTISLKNGMYKFNFGKQSFKCDNSNNIPIIAFENVSKNMLTENEHYEWSLNLSENMDSENLVLFNNGEIVQCRLNTPWQGIRSNYGLKLHSGCYYFEVTQLENRCDSLAMIGWTLGDTSNLELGSHKMSWGYGADREGFGLNGNQGKKMHDDDIENYGKAFSKNDVIGSFLNLNDYSISWSLNGAWFGKAYQIDQSLLTSSEFIIFPTIYLKNNTIEVNFGYRKFRFDNTLNHTEYVPISQAPLKFIRQTEIKTKKVRQGFAYASPGDILNIKLKSTNTETDKPALSIEERKDPLEEATDLFSKVIMDFNKNEIEEENDKHVNESDIVEYNRIPTIQTKAIRFANPTDTISEESESINNNNNNGTNNFTSTTSDNDIGAKDKFPIVLTKTSYFRYGENNHKESDQTLISNNSSDEICSLVGKENIEKRINELTSSIHRRSSGAEGGDVREVTLFKSKTKDRTEAAVIRHIVLDTDYKPSGQDLK